MTVIRTWKTVLAAITLLLFLAPVASAQTPSAAIGTVSVTVEGYATAPADTAYVVIVLGKDQGLIDTAREQIPGLEPNTTPVDPNGVITAMTDSGVVASNITQPSPLFQGEWGPDTPVTPATLLVQVDAPTVDSITAMQRLVMDAAHDDGYYLNGFNVLYAVNDCAALRSAARSNAVEAAREEAEMQASAMDSTLGDILSTRDVQPMAPMGWQPSNCVRGFDINRAITSYGVPVFDPNQPAQVVVWVGLEVTFEIP